ncbi:MAG: phosphoglycerate dehydrogenase [Thermoanaerobaculia bacterium]
MNRILVADPLHAAGLAILRQSGSEVHLLAAEERPELAEMIDGFDALIVRSMTQVDGALLRQGKSLKVVGRAGIGVDNVDVATATELGILVVNAPTANLVSATEHTFALLLALARNVPAAHQSLLAGEWDRKRFIGTELNGKTLGLIGLGRIGQNVAYRAKAFGMKVVAFDPFLDVSAARRLDVELSELAALLKRSDVVSVHTPLTDQTRGLLDGAAISGMKAGALLVNCARGGVVDEKAVLEALESGHLGGVALDVFEHEPPTNSRLVAHPRAVVTPHIGAQTREAQERVATETARMVLGALEGSLELTAVNLPFLPTGGRAQHFVALAEQLGSLCSSLLGSSVLEVKVELWGMDEDIRVPLTIAALKGALSPFLGEAVNFVNAEMVAEGRGIEVVRSVYHSSGEYPELVGVTLSGENGSAEVAGTVFGEADPRVVRLEGYRLEFRAKGRLLLLRNSDVPGVVGTLGTLLGEAGINIAEIHLARKEGGGEALAVLRLDQAPPESTIAALEALPEISQVRVVELESI